VVSARRSGGVFGHIYKVCLRQARLVLATGIGDRLRRADHLGTGV